MQQCRVKSRTLDSGVQGLVARVLGGDDVVVVALVDYGTPQPLHCWQDVVACLYGRLHTDTRHFGI